MKIWQRYAMVLAMAVGALAFTSTATAAGQRGGDAKKGGQQLRDGTCATTSTKSQTRDRLKDGTCATTSTKSQTRDRLKDASCTK